MKRRGNLLQGTVRTATGLVFATALGATASAHAVPKLKVSAPTSDAPAKAAKSAKASKSERAAKPAKVDPAAATALKEQADALQREGRTDEAAKLYAQAHDADPSNVEVAEEYGRSLYALSKYREAADLFQKVASRSEPAAYWNLGYALRKLHDYQGAADAYFSYVKLNPDDPDGFYSLAECYRKLGRNEDALTAYDLYLKKETRPEEQAWVDKAKKKIEDIKAVEAAKLQAQNTITAPAGGVGGGIVISLPGATPAPVTETTPAPVAVTPEPVAVTPTPVVVAPAPAETSPVVVAAPEATVPNVTVPVTPAPIETTPAVVAMTPVVTPAPAATEATPTVTVVTPAPVVETPAPTAPVVAGLPRDPAAAMAKVKDGDRFFQQKQWPEALSAYQEAVKLDDQNTGALLKTGLVFANQNRFQEAIDIWEQVLKIDPANKYAPNYIAKAKPRLAAAPEPAAPTTQPLQATVPLSAAAAPVETAAPAPAAPKTVTPEDEAAAKDAYRRAAQLMREQKFSEAATEASAALDRNPNYVNAYVARAGANYSLKNYPAAIADYFKALTLNPDMATPLYGLARTYERQGDNANACVHYRKYAASSAADAQANLKEQAEKQAVALCGQ